MGTVGGRIGWIGTRSGTAHRPGIAGPTTAINFQLVKAAAPAPSFRIQIRDTYVLSNRN